MRKIATTALVKTAAFLNAKNEKGVTAIEYGMLAALIVLAIIGVVATVGTNLSGAFSAVGNQVKAP
ncbi:Flp family type IVb pilin [Phenylobacterium soli]|uniref:Flp family type IVb pilin n=1 Tax=Phenylobacterium soli TaxID=2170551 RepID=A0A328AN05_9CAUL|nr:Flp family type IVb pilin [Phenylobacterium soli]RAK55927.1 Flp family type IVb pilin [Phenylobacterium soli]